jgi:hypothetical protein
LTESLTQDSESKQGEIMIVLLLVSLVHCEPRMNGESNAHKKNTHYITKSSTHIKQTVKRGGSALKGKREHNSFENDYTQLKKDISEVHTHDDLDALQNRLNDLETKEYRDKGGEGARKNGALLDAHSRRTTEQDKKLASLREELEQARTRSSLR